MRRVVALMRRVKTNTETPKETGIIHTLFFWSEPPAPPSMTGSMGKTHGAKIVRIPAKNDKTSNVIMVVNYE